MSTKDLYVIVSGCWFMLEGGGLGRTVTQAKLYSKEEAEQRLAEEQVRRFWKDEDFVIKPATEYANAAGRELNDFKKSADLAREWLAQAGA